MATTLKATVLTARLRFIDATLGASGRARVLARLPAADQAILSRKLLPVEEFPLALHARLDDAIAAEIGDTARAYREMGRFSASENLKQFHASFLDPEDPQGTLVRLPRIYASYYSDGKAEYARTGPKSGVARVTGQGSPSSTDCLTSTGYFERLVEMSGGKSPTVEHTECAARGDRACVWKLSWQ